MADYSMDQFIADVKAVQAAHTDPKDILQRVAPLAQKIADAKDWVNDSHYRVEESQGIGITVIHEEPEDLLVETVCWSPGGGYCRTTIRPGAASSASTGRRRTSPGCARTTEGKRDMPISRTITRWSCAMAISVPCCRTIFTAFTTKATCRRSRCISTDAAWPSRTVTNSIRR